jgi:acetoin utilization deacetylase AcuC-like enzyme
LEGEAFLPLIRESAPEATEEQLTRVHPIGYVRESLSVRPPEGERVPLDGDTLMSAGSCEAALRSAGGAVMGVDAVMEGWAKRVFVATRPPGHHAETHRPMGFCLFANAAIAARHGQARWGLGRVAVVDFDVHHGNGTQEIFYNDPGLFYGSSHQYPCYPGTGAAAERGRSGNVVNAPIPPGSTGAVFRAAWDETILPALDGFAPELLIVSAGFDAHKADPLAQLRLETSDFGWVTKRLMDVADRHCGGRLVSVLEGGYDLDALAASAALHVRTLMEA